VLLDRSKDFSRWLFDVQPRLHEGGDQAQIFRADEDVSGKFVVRGRQLLRQIFLHACGDSSQILRE